MLNIEQAKNQADTLASYLRTVGKNLKHTHALEAVARMNGHKSWNTFQTESLAAASPVSTEQQLSELKCSIDGVEDEKQLGRAH